MKRHMLLTMLLLMAVALLLPNIYATTTNQQNSEVIANSTDQNLNNTANSDKTNSSQSTTASSKAVKKSQSDKKIQNTLVSNSTKTTSNKQGTSNIQFAKAAAGNSNVQTNWFTTKQIAEAAGQVKSYIETNHKLPSTVKIGTRSLTMPQFLRLLTTGVIQINKGSTSSIAFKGVNVPKKSVDSVKSGKLTKAQYLDIAGRVQSYISGNGRSPNYATSSLGKVSYQSMVYLYSRILAYQYKNKVLPNTASLSSWGSVTKTTSTTSTSTQKATTTTSGFTIAQIGQAAGSVKSFIEKNNRLPNFVKVNGRQVTMPQFLRILNTGLLQINSKISTPIALKSAGAPGSPSGSVKTGNIDKSGYLNLANRVQKYMDSKGKAPNYATSSLGNIRYESLIYLEARIVSFYTGKKSLPSYAAVSSWKTASTSSTVPSSLAKYLRATANCQVNSATIKNLANSLTRGKTSSYDKATAIFNWVRNNVVYDFYYGTRKGAVGTYNARTGNCVDQSHLLIALTRAAGIPARYEYGYTKFSDGWFKHVWAQVYTNGKWYRADAISTSNSFGVIRNWDTSNWTQYGIYAEF